VSFPEKPVAFARRMAVVFVMIAARVATDDDIFRVAALPCDARPANPGLTAAGVIGDDGD
jgi:hypothetical protein